MTLLSAFQNAVRSKQIGSQIDLIAEIHVTGSSKLLSQSSIPILSFWYRSSHYSISNSCIIQLLPLISTADMSCWNAVEPYLCFRLSYLSR